MLGQIKWYDGRRIRQRQTEIFGLPLFSVEVPFGSHRRERALRKGARLLIQYGVTRVLTPPKWEFWPELTGWGLRPVDTEALRCALAPCWVAASLKAKGILPEQAVLVLAGERESVQMAAVARRVCPWVRNVVIDVPAGGALAAELRYEFGLPILSGRGEDRDLTLHFSFGPVLDGAVFSLRGGRRIPGDIDTLPLLSALWENQRIKTEDIALLI